jgi:hypothetical protein
MQRTLPLALAALLGAALAAPASAQAPQEPGPGQAQAPITKAAETFMKQLDTDTDGKVSQAEAVAPQGARFKTIDANGDGFATADELHQSFMARIPPNSLQKLKERGLGDPGESLLRELDKSGDGKVDLGESQQPTVEGFKRMDGDGDGFATPAEADAFFRKVREQVHTMQQQQQQGQPPTQ